MSKELEEFIKEELGLPVHRLASGEYQSFGAAMAEKTYKRFAVYLPIDLPAVVQPGYAPGEIPHHYSDLVEYAQKMQYDCKVANSVVNAQQKENQELRLQCGGMEMDIQELRQGNDPRKAQVEMLQADLTRMNAQFDELAAAVGFTKERCEETGESPLDCANQLKAEIDQLHIGMKGMHEAGELLDSIEADLRAERDGYKAKCEALESQMRDARTELSNGLYTNIQSTAEHVIDSLNATLCNLRGE